MSEEIKTKCEYFGLLSQEQLSLTYLYEHRYNEVVGEFFRCRLIKPFFINKDLKDFVATEGMKTLIFYKGSIIQLHMNTHVIVLPDYQLYVYDNGTQSGTGEIIKNFKGTEFDLMFLCHFDRIS
jgi:hypothetical protein